MAFSWAKLPFGEAIRFFVGKLLDFPTESYQDLTQEEHDWAFAVAGATKAELLADLRREVSKAIENGSTAQEFRREFEGIVQRHGWSHRGGTDWRARTIYDTNLRTAYAAGRAEQMQDPSVLRDRPYWEWNHGGSVRPRPHHLSLDGKIFPADHPFWQSMYPPCGWGCKCFVTSLSARDLERMGRTPDTPPAPGQIETFTDAVTGKGMVVRYQADPGWGNIHGQSRRENRQEVLQGLLERLPPDLREQVDADIRREQGG